VFSWCFPEEVGFVVLDWLGRQYEADAIRRAARWAQSALGRVATGPESDDSGHSAISCNPCFNRGGLNLKNAHLYCGVFASDIIVSCIFVGVHLIPSIPRRGFKGDLRRSFV
jgi:hypothetical protein